jgi:hypothetical protein
VQGALGDCWLVSALASASEHPECIRHCFLTKEYSPRGRYVVRLWDERRRKWELVTVDDRIPCRRGTREPLFAKPHGAELWTMVLEKAVAKFCGSYAALGGGFSVWAWQAMTGDPVFTLWHSSGGWKRRNMAAAAESGRLGRRAVRFTEDDGELTDDEVWKLLCKYDRQGALLGAAISKSGPGGNGPCGEQVRMTAPRCAGGRPRQMAACMLA